MSDFGSIRVLVLKQKIDYILFKTTESIMLSIVELGRYVTSASPNPYPKVSQLHSQSKLFHHIWWTVKSQVVI